jgi:hypothetical protein
MADRPPPNSGTSSSAYPIYTDPTCRIHGILKFKSGLKEGNEKRDYMQDAGGTMSRLVGGIVGALGSLQHTAYIGPKSLNGGEVVVGAGKLGYGANLGGGCSANGCADGTCEYMYRMQNTVDHTSVAELARIVGVEKAAPEHE